MSEPKGEQPFDEETPGAKKVADEEAITQLMKILKISREKALELVKP